MKKRQILILLTALMVFTVILAGCEKPVPVPVSIDYRKQPIEKTTLLKYKNGVFVFDQDGKQVKVDKNDIREITFGEKQTQESITTQEIVKVDEKEFEKYKKYFKIAEETLKKYPDVEGINIVDEGTWTLHPDGTRENHIKIIGIILKPSAKSWGKMAHYLDKSRFKIEVKRGRTITPDGKIYDMDPKSIKIAKPTRGAKFYSRGEVFSFTLPNVEVGNLVEFDYVVKYFNPFNPDIFQGRWYFASTEPVVHSKVNIIVPKDKKLQFATRNMTAKSKRPKITEDGDNRIYTWETFDTPPLVKELMMPGLGDVLPKIAFTTTPSWDFLMSWSNKLIKEKIAVTPEIEQKVNEIVTVAKAKTKEEKLAAIYHWVQKNIEYISIKGDISTGWTGHPALETMTNGYGDCIDKAILFSTMLKVVEIESYPISVRTRGEGTAIRDIPMMDANHAITEVILDGKTIILDSTSPPFRYPYFPTSDKGISYVNETTKKIGFIPDNKPEENSWLRETEGELTEEGDLKITEKWMFFGDYEMGFKGFFKMYKGEYRTKTFQNYLNSISPGAQLKDLVVKNEETIAEPLETSLNYVLPKYPVFAQDLVIFKMPVTHRFPETGLKTRRYDLVYDSVKMEGYKYKIKIPKTYKIEYIPKPVRYKSKYIDYKGSYVVEGGYLIYEDHLKILKTKVKKEDYQSHKKLLQKISKFGQEQIFFSTK